MRRGAHTIVRDTPYARQPAEAAPRAPIRNIELGQSQQPQQRAPVKTITTSRQTSAGYENFSVVSTPNSRSTVQSNRGQPAQLDNSRVVGQSVSSRDLYTSSAIPHDNRRPREINNVSWKQDTYDDEPRREPARAQPAPITLQPAAAAPARAAPVRAAPRVQGEIKTGLGAVITIQNLAPDLTDADVNRLCLNYGRNTVTAFDSLGRSCTAEVSFPSRAEAIKAVNELNGNELDGDGFVLEVFLGRSTVQAAAPRPIRLQRAQ